jgi:arsenate reductase
MLKSPMLKFYGYAKCSTCRNAQKALDAKKIAYENIDITTNPPALADLKSWLKSGQVVLKDLLNTSGIDYRAQKMSEKVKTLPAEKVLELLAKNGRLLKRPIMTDGKKVTTGFKDPKILSNFAH